MSALPQGFVFADVVVPDLRWDAKYFGSDNFTGGPVDGYQANRIVVSDQLGAALKLAQAKAKEQGLSLFIWDAYRPQRAVNRFMAWAREPENNLTRERHYPTLTRPEMFTQGYVCEKSGHSRGGTVDLTLVNLKNAQPLEMGTNFDFMGIKSHHGAAGLTAEEQQNRDRLLEIMEQSGFVKYPEEWWHYTLANEPYPDTYFDFTVTDSDSSR